MKKNARRARTSPRDAEALPHWRNALILESGGRFREAAEACRRVIELQPRNVEALCKRGLMLRQIGEYELAQEAFERALRIDPRHVETSIYLAVVYKQFKQPDRALECYERAAWLNPREIRAFTGMASMLEQLNEIDKAREAVESALGVDPKNPTARVILASLHRRRNEYDRAVEILHRLLSEAIPVGSRFRAGFELARNLEKLGQYDEAFDAVSEANRVQARTPTSLAVQTRAWLRLIADAHRFTGEHFQRWRREAPPDDAEPPVLLVGFPRSGTTMTEQVLAAHPEIAVSDEEDFLSRVYQALMASYDPERPLVDQLDGVPTERILEARRVYREQAAKILAQKPGATMMIGKNATGIVTLCVLRRVFADARVIVVHRDPRDACLSCFFQQFIANPANVYFNSLEKTLEMYRLIMDVWLAHREILGFTYREWKYEEITSDFEANARRLIEFVGRPWDDRVLRFYEPENRRFVSTPSYEAVTRPVHTGAQGRWRRYEKHLAPILPGLEPYLRTLGYRTGGEA